MEMGHVEQGIVKTATLNKLPIPDKILNAPSVLPEYAYYFDSFFELDSDRDFTFAVSRHR